MLVCVVNMRSMPLLVEALSPLHGPRYRIFGRIFGFFLVPRMVVRAAKFYSRMLERDRSVGQTARARQNEVAPITESEPPCARSELAATPLRGDL